jgi:lysophospholipase L1-like esterase
MRRVAYFLLGILPLVLLILNSNEGWHSNDGLWLTQQYVINVAIFFVLAIELFFLAFLASRAERRAIIGLCLTSASALFCLGTFDLYVLFLNRDTTGPGGRLCLTHRNWYNGTVQKNDLGYWERDVTPFQNRERGSEPKVVAAVGDSFTFGQGLHQAEHRYSNRLDQMLPRVEVLNFSLGGNDTRDQIRDILPNVKKVNPDLVLLFYLTNDIHDGIGMKMRPPVVRSKWENRLLMGSPTWNFIYWKLFASKEFAAVAADSFKAWQDRYLDATNFADHQADLQTFADEVRKMGAKPAAVILPFPHFWANTTPQLRNELLAKVEGAMKETGMPVLSLADLEETYPIGSFEITSMDAHPNATVNQAIADRVAPWIEELLR